MIAGKLLRALGMSATAALVMTAMPPADAASAPAGGSVQYAKRQDAAGESGTTARRKCRTGPIYSHNGNMVSAEMNYPGRYKGMLRARTSGNKDPKKWELFRVCDEATYSTIQLMSTGLYVSAELDYTGADYGMLRARATSVGPYEKFDIAVTCNCQFRSQANNLWVSVERAYTGDGANMLRARAKDFGKWEAFYSTTLVFQHGDYENARPPAKS